MEKEIHLVRQFKYDYKRTYLVLIMSRLATCIVTIPERIPLKIAIASECERP